MEMWMNEIWLLVTAITFTAVGWRMGTKSEQQKLLNLLLTVLLLMDILKLKEQATT